MTFYQHFPSATSPLSTFFSSQETSTHQTEVNDQRRQLEKESATRLELEDRIMSHMQQKFTHNQTAKYSQRLSSKIGVLKKEKVTLRFS